ncbi:MAG: hypothetical protein LBV69_09555, partial [Bacteroidales bacterium]|nr:hypothetical protein [Bacteroidales bacterium]
MLILLFCFITYQISNNQNKKNYFNEILINGKLNVVLNPNYYDYFLYNTEIQGYNYELLQEFANYLKLELVILTEENYQKNISSLINHDIDIFIHYNSKPESNFLTKSTLANKENYALISYDSILQIDDNILLKKNKSKLFNNYFN